MPNPSNDLNRESLASRRKENDDRVSHGMEAGSPTSEREQIVGALKLMAQNNERIVGALKLLTESNQNLAQRLILWSDKPEKNG